jgi:L-lactate dehydrogenase complex protein LldG
MASNKASNSREAILQRIRGALAQPRPQGNLLLERPATPEVWPRNDPPADDLAKRFQDELAAVHGQTIRCRTPEDAARQLHDLATAGGWPMLAAIDAPLARQVCNCLPTETIAWVTDDWSKQQIAAVPAGVLVADLLLADTGSCVIRCPTAAARLMCYLPPACVVLARLEQLREHLPAAWGEIAAACADPNARGEWVIVTGPSRTADIEKILILGVHGPKRLVVLLIG